MPVWFQQWKFVLVIAMLAASALMATERNKLPLALRGLKKILDSQNGNDKKSDTQNGGPVPAWRRLLAFLIVILALVVAIV